MSRHLTCAAVHLPLLFLVLSGLACGSSRDHPGDQVVLPLARFVPHQRANVTTDLISAPEGMGLDRIEHGWRKEAGASPAESYLEVSSVSGRFTLFSAEGDLEAVELELKLGGFDSVRRMPVEIRLNGKRVGRVRVQREWRIHRVEIPRDRVRQGLNFLAVRPRPGAELLASGPVPRVRLRFLRLRSRSGRPFWLDRPDEIRVTTSNGGPGGSSTVEMPSASCLDMVFEVPEKARFRGRFTLVRPNGDSRGVSTVHARLLDERGVRHSVFREEVASTPAKGHPVDVDLGEWSGELVRLRIGIGGEANMLVRWTGAGVRSPGPSTVLSPFEPIDRALPEPSGRLGKPDVFVVLLDAARADAFSPHGGPDPTPAAERLARDGTTFETALAAAPWTGQSVASLLTGLFPDTLGFGGWGSYLPADVPVLGELLARAGYRTVLWSQHPMYRHMISLKRGFEEAYQAPKGRYEALPTADQLTSAEQPTFAFVHLIPPHAPYRPPAPFSGKYSSWYRGDLQVDEHFLNRFPGREDPESLSPEDLKYIKDLYRDNVAFADDLVARLLAMLDEADLYRDSLVVLLSDHGEAFLEHRRFLHTYDVHREMLQVPLIVKWPGASEGFRPVVTEPVSLVDLVPTLVEGLGLPADGPGFQGRSLLPAVFDGWTEPRTQYAVTRRVLDLRRPADPALLLDRGDWRVLFEPVSDTARIYRGETDPDETEDLASDLPLRTLLLRQSLLIQSSWNEHLLALEPPQEIPDELDSETVEQLKALGYLN